MKLISIVAFRPSLSGILQHSLQIRQVQIYPVAGIRSGLNYSACGIPCHEINTTDIHKRYSFEMGSDADMKKTP